MNRPFAPTRHTAPRREQSHAFVTAVRFRLTRECITVASGRGQTVEVSPSVVVFETSCTVAPAARIELVLEWPGLYHGFESARLHAVGQVLHTAGARVEVRILRYRFELLGRALARSRAAGETAAA